jgi:hypothetical protein
MTKLENGDLESGQKALQARIRCRGRTAADLVDTSP